MPLDQVRSNLRRVPERIFTKLIAKVSVAKTGEMLDAGVQTELPLSHNDPFYLIYGPGREAYISRKHNRIAADGRMVLHRSLSSDGASLVSQEVSETPPRSEMVNVVPVSSVWETIVQRRGDYLAKMTEAVEARDYEAACGALVLALPIPADRNFFNSAPS